ncbi:hypothetical protein F4813DRAFT_350208 [Daldinia decipiens]|uniref:uncharacterized protein n=1 Tax=Daldinia decipiens TaxID=326647 RepID=UPI0020C51815|nr:uncharacterized protein F4813DRAFT_350208 [Daldinia decipiens]KAI1660527.1 hypothetical protein F4813DRAFT_350208 [Daldinia decipiens]
MAGNSQFEGVIDTHIQAPPPVRVASQPDLTKYEDKQDTIQTNTRPPIPGIIVAEPSKPPNMAARDDKPPQVIQGQDPPMVTPLDRLDKYPQWIDCPACKRRTRTNVTEEGGGMQIVVGALLCCVCPCLACLPYKNIKSLMFYFPIIIIAYVHFIIFKI